MQPNVKSYWFLHVPDIDPLAEHPTHVKMVESATLEALNRSSPRGVLHPVPSLEDLALASQSGDKVAYDELLSRLVPMVQAIAHRYGSSWGLKDDITQESLLAFHNALATYRYPGNILSWVAVISRHKAIDITKREKKYHNLVESDPMHAVAFGFDNAIFVRGILESLTLAEQVMLIGVSLEGYSFEDIAARLGGSRGALKVKHHRLVKRIRSMFTYLVW
jgi:RNA polymerase sigma-70 factor, ECF subfamily